MLSPSRVVTPPTQQSNTVACNIVPVHQVRATCTTCNLLSRFDHAVAHGVPLRRIPSCFECPVFAEHTYPLPLPHQMINFTSLPTSLPSFPSTWTAPTSCFASTNYYRVLLGSGYVSNMYGTPTPVFTGNYPTGDCWPPSSTKGVPYLTTGDCPPGFTRACATAGPESRGKLVSTVTCCPRCAASALLPIHG